jgi:hypothetical protein
MHITVYNDQPELLYPLTRLRPTWDVNVGGRTLRALLRRAFPKAIFSWRMSSRSAGGKGLFLNGRAVPHNALLETIRQGEQKQLDQAALLTAPWDVITWHDELLLQEADFLTGARGYAGFKPPATCIIRTQHGPVIVHPTTRVGDYTVLEGPLIVGADSVIHDFTKISASAVGKVCKAAGEITHSNFYSYSNKQHAGFAGHSVFASWVNVAGGTNTANLKNTLGLVRADRGGGKEDTGLQFLGSILGDYVKTGLNTALMPGTIVDVGSHVYGVVSGYVAPANIPWEVALTTVQRTMARRKKSLTRKDQELLKRLYQP